MATTPFLLFKRPATAVLALCAIALSGCTTTGLLLGAAGIATDTSVAWDIVKHVHGKLTEGDDIPCQRLDSVQRALNVRCGEFVPGSLSVADLRRSPLQDCALSVAVRDPRFWPTLPELLDKGEAPEACSNSPLVELAQQPGCPDFGAASPAVLHSIRWLAQADSRAIHHDVVRLLSCPAARLAGLDSVLDQWLAQGDLDRDRIGFGALGALHPEQLATPLARALEAQGHTARDALGGYVGVQPRGFEEALRTSHWGALEWWLQRVPELANRVPPAQGNQLPWVPLARVLVPSFLPHPAGQAEMIGFLMARGANPWQRLPFDAGRSVVAHARAIDSPWVTMLETPLRETTSQPAAVVAPRVAATPSGASLWAQVAPAER